MSRPFRNTVAFIVVGGLAACEGGLMQPEVPPEPSSSVGVALAGESLAIVAEDATTVTLELTYVGNPQTIGARNGPTTSGRPACPPFRTPANPQPSPARTVCPKRSVPVDVWAVIEESGQVRAIGPVTIPSPSSGPNLGALFAAPTASEISAVQADWASRNPGAVNASIVQTLPATSSTVSGEVRVISHVVDGFTHYGSAFVPNGLAPGSAPIVAFQHGGDGGVSTPGVFMDFAVQLLETLPQDFIYVFPSFRGEALTVSGNTYVSTGPPSYWDRDTDDALALIEATKQLVPEADPGRVAAIGVSRGGLNTLLMGARDPSLDGIVTLAAPTDFYEPWLQGLIADLANGQPPGATGLDWLNTQYIQPWVNGQLPLADMRLELIRRSVPFFVTVMPWTQIHHGTADATVNVGQAQSLISAMSAIGRTPPAFESFLYTGASHLITTMVGHEARVRNFIDGLWTNPPVDNPPTASFTWSCDGAGNCTFDGTGSTDDNGITLYEWEEDGVAVGTGATLARSYAQSTTFDMTLRVTDTAAQTDQTTQSVTVTITPPPSETLVIVGETATTMTLELVYTGSPNVIGARNGPTDAAPPVCPPFHTPANPQPSPAQTVCQKRTTPVDVWAVIEEGGTQRAVGPITIPVPGPPPTDNPPTASFTWTCDGAGNCTFDGTGSTDDNGITLYEWFEDGSPVGTGATLARSYPQSTTFDMMLRVTDTAAQTDQTTQTVSVTVTPPTDNPPTASFTWSCDAAGNCTFDGSSSTDDNGIGLYEWIVNGAVLTTGQIVNRTFVMNTTFDLTLRVTDTIGQTDETTQTVDVILTPPVDNPPTASFTWSCDGAGNCTFDGTGSTDDNGITLYEWEEDGVAVGTGATLARSYAQSTTFDMTLRVTDTAAQTDQTTQSVTVTITPPPSETLVIVGETATTMTLELVYAGSPNVIGARNGPTDTALPVCPPFHTPANPQPSPAQTVCQKRTTPLDVWAVIEEGGTQRAVGPITIPTPSTGDTPPVASYTWSCDAQRNCVFDGSASTDDNGIVSYEWLVGGSVLATGAIVNRSFLNPTTVDVTLRVTDTIGQTGQTTQTVNVP